MFSEDFTTSVREGFAYAEAFGYAPQRPADVAAMANLVIHFLKRNVSLTLELAVDLAAEFLLLRSLLRRSLWPDSQVEVGPLFLELPKSGFWVCRASAWISTSSRFSSPSLFDDN